MFNTETAKVLEYLAAQYREHIRLAQEYINAMETIEACWRNENCSHYIKR